MSQYDSIGSAYRGFNNSVYRQMETHSCEIAIRPHLKPGSRVADFGCGNGFMSRKLLDWGCASVMGTDLSPVMVQEAERLLTDQVSAGKARFSVADATSLLERRGFPWRTLQYYNPRTDLSPVMVQEAERLLTDQVSAGKARFSVADATVLQSAAPNGELGYFDAVVGGWLLNYSPDSRGLVAMFTNIALNLKHDGFFFGIVPHPTNDLEKRARLYSGFPFTHIVPKNTYTTPLPSGQGWNLHVELPNNVHIDAFHLNKDVMEECARLGGLKGRLEWKTEVLLGNDWKKLFNEVMTDQDWQIRSLSPHFGILIVYKN